MKPELPRNTGWQILIRQLEARFLSRRRFGLIARVMSLALLIGQLGAEAHAYSHLSDHSKGLPDTVQSCRACLSFAPVQSAVGGGSSAFVVAECAPEIFAALDAIQLPLGPPHRAFQSRAPPTLL
jgi:hypothetical protein